MKAKLHMRSSDVEAKASAHGQSHINDEFARQGMLGTLCGYYAKTTRTPQLVTCKRCIGRMEPALRAKIEVDGLVAEAKADEDGLVFKRIGGVLVVVTYRTWIGNSGLARDFSWGVDHVKCSKKEAIKTVQAAFEKRRKYL